MKSAPWTGIASFLEFAMSLELPQGGVALYRGQPLAAALLPKAVRKAPMVDSTSIERRMLAELRRQGSLLSQLDQATELELMALAQHYGMATRLLDWTSNPLVALWFACREYTSTELGHMYFYRVYPDNIENAKSSIDPFKLSMTRVFQPTLNSPRIAAQNGWFSIHPHMGTGFGYQALDNDVLHFLSIYHFEIPHTKKIGILNSLDTLGINSRTLFPDLDGLAKHINWIFSRELSGLHSAF